VEAMKTNRSARKVAKIRGLVTCLALVGMVGTTFGLGEVLAVRVGQTTGPRIEAAQAPNASFADLMAIAR
jgi:hypothetical protein